MNSAYAHICLLAAGARGFFSRASRLFQPGSVTITLDLTRRGESTNLNLGRRGPGRRRIGKSSTRGLRPHWGKCPAACVIALLLLLGTGAGAADEACLAVVYPQVREPYRSVLEEIVRGVETSATLRVLRVVLADEANDTQARRATRECVALVGLARAGMDAVQAWRDGRAAVAGAVVLQPGEIQPVPVISLVPDPAELLSRLQRFAPKVRRVTVIYDPRNTAALIEHARKAAQRLGLELIAHPARELREAVPLYEAAFKSFDANNDALWLAQDASTVDEGSVLPLVLERAWTQKVVVFSSQAGYVRRGVLFSVFPDNTRMGALLEALLRECMPTACPDAPVRTLSALKTAVNTRVAARLELRFDSRDVDMLFPEDARE